MEAFLLFVFALGLGAYMWMRTDADKAKNDI